jgi:hypothetical protein
MARTLYTIARDIKADWKKPYFGAVPYIQAMSALEDINSDFGADSAKTIIVYFLANAGTWRGEKAKAIKAELKAIAGIK